MTVSSIDRLIFLLAKLPGLGPRSARRAALYLIKRKDALFAPLFAAMGEVLENIVNCSVCGNIGVNDPCAICADQNRDASAICIVEEVADLWALERLGSFKGRYHVLGGVLSALDGVGPEDLNIPALAARAAKPEVKEVIIATNATVDGQTTAHYIASRLERPGVKITGLAHGAPIGGELDYLDEGTLMVALKGRGPL